MLRHQILFLATGLVACNAVLGLEDVTRAPSAGTGGGAGASGGSSADGGSSGKAGGGQGGGGKGGTAGSQSAGGTGAEAGGQGEGGVGAEAGNPGEGGAGTGAGGEGGGGPVECAPGTFDTDGDANTPCQSFTDCEQGQYILAEGTAETDRTCAACDSGTFSTGQNTASCSDWTDCLPGTYVSEDGDADSDRQCDDCPSGYQSTTNNQAMCLLPGACEPGTVEITPPTMTDPAVCDDCDAGTFCAGGSAAAVPCDDENWDHDADPATSCAAWTDCLAGNSVDDPGSPTENRTCTSCANGTFSTTANATTCADWRTCAAGTYMSSAGSAMADRACTGCANGTFTATANQTSCADWRTCAAGTYVTNAGSTTADRTCTACTNGFSTSTNATSCTLWRTCTWAQGGVAQAGTPTTDAVCGSPSAFRQFGTSAEDSGRSVALDASGNVYIVGDTQGSLDGTNAGSFDGYVRKYNSSGTYQWTLQFGTSSEDRAEGIGVDASGNIYVAGQTAGALSGMNAGSSDGFLRKYNSSRAHQWTQQFGTSSADVVEALAIGANGTIYVAGQTAGALVGTNAGGQDAFVRAYNAAGGHLWTQQFGTSTNDVAFGLGPDPSGAIYVSGNTDGSLSGTSAGGQDSFVRKYASDGTPGWIQQFGTSVIDLGRGVAVDASANVYMVGFTTGSLGGTNAGNYDAYLRKWDSSGTHIWTQQYGTSVQDYAQDVAISPTGNVLVTGYTQGALVGTNAGMTDAYARKFNSGGTHQWTQQWGTATQDLGFGVVVDANANVYAVGSTQGALVGTNAGVQDVYVIQIPGG